MYYENGCDTLIAIGGGSAMDCAKGIGARVAHPKKTLNKMGGVMKVLRRTPTLIAIPTTAVMSVPVLLREEIEENALLCPMIDARRNEVYATIYDRALGVVRPTHAEVVTEESYRELLDKQPIYFFGNGAEKCSKIINHPNAHFLTAHRDPLAKNMMPLAERAWFDEKFEDIAYFEPFYLKNFVATKPKELLKNS
jgi:tRNA threonylcarbamoyladenosine biosynthesis protein TsaB